MSKISGPKPEITEADLKALNAQSDQVLAEWYCLLNSWKWPNELPDPEGKIHGSSCRRSVIMGWIGARVGGKLCSRVWNKEMTDEEHEDFWRAHFENDEAAKRRYHERMKKKFAEAFKSS